LVYHLVKFLTIGKTSCNVGPQTLLNHTDFLYTQQISYNQQSIIATIN